MRFLADVGVSPQIAAWLRSQGHDVEHLLDSRQFDLADETIFAAAAAANRIIITFDLDFGAIAAAAVANAGSILLFRLSNPRNPSVLKRLETVLSAVTEPLQRGAIVVVEDARVRVRDYPILPADDPGS